MDASSSWRGVAPSGLIIIAQTCFFNGAVSWHINFHLGCSLFGVWSTWEVQHKFYTWCHSWCNWDSNWDLPYGRWQLIWNGNNSAEMYMQSLSGKVLHLFMFRFVLESHRWQLAAVAHQYFLAFLHVFHTFFFFFNWVLFIDIVFLSLVFILVWLLRCLRDFSWLLFNFWPPITMSYHRKKGVLYKRHQEPKLYPDGDPKYPISWGGEREREEV